MKIKTGIGFDVHRFCEGRKLILGGVEIPYKYGLLGYSDADVLIHAIIDSILSPACGLDIGKVFPDNDKRYKDIDSKILLEHAVNMVTEKGFYISNVDCTVIAEAPKISPFIDRMREALSAILKIEYDDVTINGTTTEKLGFTGRSEGVAVLAVSTLIKE
ncbi:2-C-methyl-D-erythritol 2,4-cyclodiphosphate synthase [Deferribacter abyssi]